MKLLLKVVKSSQVRSDGDTVSIDNTVKMPAPPLPIIDPDEINEIDEAELLEKQRAEAEIKRIEAEVERRVQFLKKEIEQKKKDIIESTEKSRAAILANASAESAEIIAKANQEAVSVKELARKEGHDEGYKTGKSEASAQCEKYIQAAAQFLSGINAKKEAYFISHEDELLKTVLDMVKKITLDEVKTDKDTIFRILKQAARTFRNDDYLKITLAECDVNQEIVTDLDFIKGIVGNIKEIDVEVLQDAESGTVTVDNGSEIIDASVPTQLDLLKEIMNNRNNL